MKSANKLQNDFSGLIVDRERTHLFFVTKCPERHAGLGRALIHHSKRDRTKRFDVVRLAAANGHSTYAAVVGHRDNEKVIKLDYDLREALGLDVGECARIEVTKCSMLGTLWWYLTVPDPLVRVPAFLACVSLVLGVLSFVFAIKP
jgi:hypothetical protein